MKKSKPKAAKVDPVPPSAPVEPAPPAAPSAIPPAVAESGSKVPGILDSQLHASLHEAHRVLTAGADAWQKVLDNVEGQFVRPLLNAHDGDAATCAAIQAQVAAFRELYR